LTRFSITEMVAHRGATLITQGGGRTVFNGQDYGRRVRDFPRRG
jgi:hypothetical protein